MEKILMGVNIEKSFGIGDEKSKILDGVTIEVYEGEFVSIMGPSGSGKSTLMYALSGMDAIDGGSVSFDNRELSKLRENELADIRRTKMGFVFQQPTMLRNLNILDNIILPSMRENRKDRLKLVEKAKNLMKRAGIEGLDKRDVSQVSGGQLQRAGICRALMSQPKIIFGDEPTGSLNSKSAHEIMDLFTDINKDGTAVILVTHDANVAARTERILFMRDGKIVTELRLPKHIAGDLTDRVEKINSIMRELGI